jgi:hypothetical protein
MAKSPASNDTLELPDAVYEELQRLRDLIRSDTVKRDLWANRFTAADRRKFAGPEKEVLKQHHTIELWHIARSTPTPNQCIVEAAYAVGLINELRRESLLDALGAKPRAGKIGKQRSAAVPHWDAAARVPKSFPSTLKAGLFSSAQTGLETALLAGRPHRGTGSRHRLWMSITGRKVG